MDATRLPALIFMVMLTFEYAETTDPRCKDLNPYPDEFNLIKGESFEFVPRQLKDPNVSNEQVKWYKTPHKNISSEETERIHYRGRALFLLNVTSEDAGIYTCQYNRTSGKCYNFHVKIGVFPESYRNSSEVLYGEINNSDWNKKIECPDPVYRTCSRLNGIITWHKLGNFMRLPNEDQYELWIHNATKKDEGVYVCVCTWTHSHVQYKSTGGRKLVIQNSSACRDLEILHPLPFKEQLVYEGSELKLRCSVLCGTNTQCHCSAAWDVNGMDFNMTPGYSVTHQVVTEDHSKNTVATAVLTIETVSAKDFDETFKCVGLRVFESVASNVTLKQRESIIPLVIGGVSVFFLCVFAAVIVKCFAIDLALLFRRCLPFRRPNKGAMVFDAYVVYQLQGEDKVTEDALCQFVTKTLPNVLEEKCGYRLFIHGRDDMPGEDHLELVEHRMKKSRRLIVILTPGSGSGSEVIEENPVLGGFDCQVGLHHALVQREMTVILIQLGDTGPRGYTHLPPGLQHLIQKSAPIKWPQDSRGAASSNSRFWKRVRYLMPAIPAGKYPQSAII